ncbi:vacuolar protein [Phaeodactylum tricornutum CCAP 1055/1]|uniref:vesicle-fusing ATPase n=1 Tax=Phaeodactylum tricornutum (strain CCAP 1055/1) TaxID=556484 RepID=B7GCY6_PHATC|nr:vacuolar protein [Phaeodactylum tricornutum CCAP 1055/1]EEC43405.1 vacuolar protein [Phaeodactylum tricornutum CCAP 1055/1]|eukprot:XP_002184958.1 vacuolar protein [Phaeodactylum tricornutum CCAP 1055/1]
MENSLIPQGIEMVQKAISADNEGEYEKALGLYRDALARFTMGLKYEKNEARKKLILERVEGYMNRAEELSDYVKKQSELDKNGGGGVAAKNKDDGDDDGDADKKKLRGSLSAAIVTEKPNISWEDVAGLENAKESLKETVILPTKFPQLFTGKRKPFKGILLYGPPGTGKSYLAKAVATEADSTFFSVSSADLISKWQGESERLVRNLFEMARESPGSRAIIFIDEVDSLCGSRSEGESDSLRRVKTEFLVQMDGVGKQDGQVLVLGATNIPWELDAAIRRRFEKRVYIPLPEAEARSYMLKLHLGDTPNDLEEEDFDRLGTITEGASGSDIQVLVKEALMEPLRRCQQAKQFYKDEEGYFHPCTKYPNCSNLWDVPGEKLRAPKVVRKDFEKVMKHSVATVSPDELKRFVDWTKMFGQDGA